ncbi:MAG TPA: DUF58 domain-containing protein [Planctomycetota bacterium]|nr:DUF58 domain-containing protein [Planctomycetota bacterium]HRR82009.1 DUF58 domain-containing protein [Planctomycetota bacterium]HRT95088.1 DUF58 domain-containing protein [Planctomycetota bacterium]
MASPRQHKLRYLDPETLQRIGPLELVAREVVEGLHVGMHKSPLKGFSTEFSHHRQYVPGDETRHLDWRVYARTERYYLKLFEAETNFTANLLLDASSSMHFGSHAVTKLEYAKFMAASMAYLCVRQRDSAGLAVFDNQLRSYIEPKTTMGVVRTIAEELEKVEGLPRTNVAAILHEFANRIPRRGFVMLFSDLFDHVAEFVQGIEHLRFKGHNVAVFHVLDPHELQFPYDGSCKFIGLEEDGEVVTQPKRIRAAYLEELRKFLQEIRRACERAHVDYTLVDTSRPVDAVLSGYLIGRIRSVHVR